jgi:drug/metabolite transporter (DMT)-like permease
MTQPAGRSEVAAMAIALAGYAIFSIGDALVRSMAGAWPGSAIALLRYAIGAAMLGGLLLAREGRTAFSCPLPLVQVGRGAAIALATTCFFTTLGFMPLADATAIQFTSPMWVALLSAVLFGERIGWRRALLILIAFGGVLVILRPDLVRLGPIAALPLLAALFMAMLIMLNRRAAGATSILQSQFLIAFIATLILLPVTIIGHLSGAARFAMAWPAPLVVLKCAGVAVTGTIGHLLLFVATTRASATAVAPMTYVQILVAIAIGWAAFGTRPDAAMLAGSGLVIAAGLILFRISRRAAQDVGESGSTPE